MNKKVPEAINKPNKQLLCQALWSVNSSSLLHLEYSALEEIFGRIAAILPFSLQAFHPTLMYSSFSSLLCAIGSLGPDAAESCPLGSACLGSRF